MKKQQKVKDVLKIDREEQDLRVSELDLRMKQEYFISGLNEIMY